MFLDRRARFAVTDTVLARRLGPCLGWVAGRACTLVGCVTVAILVPWWLSRVGVAPCPWWLVVRGGLRAGGPR